MLHHKKTAGPIIIESFFDSSEEIQFVVKGHDAIELNHHPEVDHHLDACTRMRAARTLARTHLPTYITYGREKVSIDGFTIADHKGQATTMLASETKGLKPRH